MWPLQKPRHSARDLVAEGALLLDVRTPAEFQQRHVPGAVNIPLHELEARMSEVRPEARSVVVYCRSGARSASAAQLLQRAGCQVLDIGSMDNW